MNITGATRLYAIIGDPIAQVRSPEVFTDLFAAAGANAVLIPIHVPSARFDSIIPGLMAMGNLDGVLVTIPFKARMRPFADRLTAAAECIGAVNALRRETDGSWSGEMFDGVGFVRAVRAKGATLHGRRVLMFGAGGAGSAIAYELAAAGVDSIAIRDPDYDRAVSLAKVLHTAFPSCQIAASASNPSNEDMIVNASPVGMRPGDGMPGALGTLAPGTLVGDVIVSVSPTALIQHAMRHQCTVVTGRDMHAGQIEAIMRFFAPAEREATTDGAAR